MSLSLIIRPVPYEGDFVQPFPPNLGVGGGGTVLELPCAAACCAHRGAAQVMGFVDIFSPKHAAWQRSFSRIPFDAESMGRWFSSCLWACFGGHVVALTCRWADLFIPSSRQTQTQKFARKCARRMSSNPSCPSWRIIRW